jgi:hypothetical protein
VKTIPVGLPDELADRLEAEAKAAGESRAAYIRALVTGASSKPSDALLLVGDLPETLKAWLEAASERRGMTQKALMVRCLERCEEGSPEPPLSAEAAPRPPVGAKPQAERSKRMVNTFWKTRRST